jgi:stalled ribosome alternative rescue factor ArfA
MKKLKPIVITVEVLRKIEKTAHRKALVDAGMYARPTHKVHKGAKDYTRKAKHKKNILD